jgi:4-coumarate--CoA ligase
VVHPTCFIAARAAGQKVGLTDDSLILLEKSNLPLSCSTPTIEQLIMFGSSESGTFKPLLLKAGEAKTTLAFLSFSSGTTGK